MLLHVAHGVGTNRNHLVLALRANVVERKLGQNRGQVLSLLRRVDLGVGEVDLVQHQAVVQVAYLGVTNED